MVVDITWETITLLVSDSPKRLRNAWFVICFDTTHFNSQCWPHIQTRLPGVIWSNFLAPNIVSRVRLHTIRMYGMPWLKPNSGLNLFFLPHTSLIFTSGVKGCLRQWTCLPVIGIKYCESRFDALEIVTRQKNKDQWPQPIYTTHARH